MRSKKGSWGHQARKFLISWLEGNKTRLTTRYLDEETDLPIIRRRKEFAQSIIGDVVFSEAIQMMNEQIFRDIADTDALDSERLRVLRLRLETVSEFPVVLAMFIDHYEQIAAKMMQEQQDYDQREIA